MKTFSVYLEKMTCGMVRVTGRIKGQTIVLLEGAESNSKDLVIQALRKTAGGQEISRGIFSMKFIELNDMASAAYAMV